MVNDYAIFILYYKAIKDLEFSTFLEILFKEGIKFLGKYFKADSVLCSHKNVIRLYINIIFIGLVGSSEYSMVGGTPYNCYCVFVSY